MGNCSSINQHYHSSGATAKVILWDGTVHCFDDQITAAELMLEHPQHVVVEFDPATMTAAGKRATLLPADRILNVRKIYFMLPFKGGKPVSLSSDGARRVLSIVNSLLGQRSLLLASTASGFLPLMGKMFTAGAVHDEVLKKNDGAKLEDSMTMVQDSWCGSVGREYLSRKISGKGWKPSLDTIVEKKLQNRDPHCLFSS